MYGIQCHCSPLHKKDKNVTFHHGMNSKEGTKRGSVNKQRTQNHQHIVDTMPKWDKKRSQKKTKHQEN